MSARCLSVAEAADFLDVHPKTVRSLIDRGELPAYRVGRLLKIAPDGLEQLRHVPGDPLEAPPRSVKPRPITGEFAQLARRLG